MRLFILALVGLISLGPVFVHAQDSTTSCQTNGGIMNCHTYANPTSGGGAVSGFAQGLSRGFQNGAKLRAARAEARAQEQANQEEETRKARYAKAGQLINTGQCPEARSFALTSGDLDLAQRVGALCPASLAK
jgi:hypothetical protein